MGHAAEFMEQSYDEREPVLMVYFREYADWQPLRNHQRSADVRRRLPLPGDLRTSGDADANRPSSSDLATRPRLDSRATAPRAS
jgi:hypothetical protein